MPANGEYPLTVYYDRACPLCRTEMTALKRLDGTDRLHLVDCSGLPPSHPLQLALHAQTANGRWLVGVDALAAVYSAVGLSKPERWLSNRFARAVAAGLYRAFARWRYVLSALGFARPFGRWLDRLVEARAASQVCSECCAGKVPAAAADTPFVGNPESSCATRKQRQQQRGYR